jgi:hypothetical protein
MRPDKLKLYFRETDIFREAVGGTPTAAGSAGPLLFLVPVDCYLFVIVNT